MTRLRDRIRKLETQQRKTCIGCRDADVSLQTPSQQGAVRARICPVCGRDVDLIVLKLAFDPHQQA